jgi:YT521-B-like domain
MDLKDHFSRDAIKDIESVFLISKSNCAFVNYKTESSCAAAMSRFHDSRFQGVRLVCRLRRGSASAASATQPSPIVAPSPTTAAQLANESNVEGAAVDESAIVDQVLPSTAEPMEKVKEKFFVVKSLTIEDLERSLQTGVWATQAHNEEALNQAYKVSGCL